MSIRTFQYQIFPNPEQESLFLCFAGCRRVVWNWGVEYKRSFYAETGKGIGYNALAKQLTYLKSVPSYSFLKKCHSQVLQQALLDLEQSYQNYFQALAEFKRGHRSKDSIPGLPSFKSRHNSPPTFRFPESVSLSDIQVSLPHLGFVDI